MLLWAHTLWLSLDPVASEAQELARHTQVLGDTPTSSLQSRDDPLTCRVWGRPLTMGVWTPLTCRAQMPPSPAEPVGPTHLQSPDAP